MFTCEKDVQNVIMNNDITKTALMNILGAGNGAKFIPEDSYINGIIVDFTMVENESIKSLIECKGPEINVTDYVRGIGQIFQYEYFGENNISMRHKGYYENFTTAYIIPSSIIKNSRFNISRFKYPNRLKLIEINDTTYYPREINSKELESLGNSEKENLTSISQYYIRDNRLFELYLLLRILLKFKMSGEKKIDRCFIEEKFLTKLQTPNNKNWRNAFISLSSLGFIDNNNLPTPSGFSVISSGLSHFIKTLASAYIMPYIEEIMTVIYKDMKISNPEISEKIKNKYSNKDVLFLTESNARYISSWLSILRDDLGCIEYEPRKDYRKVIYKPHELSKDSLLAYIEKNTKAKIYENKLDELIKKGEI